MSTITDKQLAESERLLAELEHFVNISAIGSLIARLKVAEQDAARWRFVKDKQTFIWLMQDWFPSSEEFTDVNSIIDNAMANQK